MKWPVFVCLLLIVNQSQAAPKNAAMDRLDLANDEPIGNPLHFGQDELKLLQNYLKSTDKVDRDPEALVREQVLLYLFAMYDLDKRGHLDGLDLMKLLSDVVAQNSNRPPSLEAVIAIVDEILENQDLNRDGLLDPSELLTPPSNASLPQAVGEAQQEDTPLLVLQPPHGAHPNEVNDPSLEPLDQDIPASEGGAALDQQGSEVPINLQEHSSNPQNPPLVEHGDAAPEEDLNFEAHETLTNDEAAADVVEEQNQELHHEVNFLVDEI